MVFAAGIFALGVAAIGWFYLFYSRAAHRLSGVESSAANAARVRLRRISGGLLIVVAGLFFVGFKSALDDSLPPRAFLAVWSIVLLLLMLLVLLALVDVRLTAKLRRAHRDATHLLPSSPRKSPHK